jgi:hypothetical protein
MGANADGLGEFDRGGLPLAADGGVQAAGVLAGTGNPEEG